MIHKVLLISPFFMFACNSKPVSEVKVEETKAEETKVEKTTLENRPVGGFTESDVLNEEVKKAADFAITTQADVEKTSIELVSITAAETQVVAGMNYKLTLEVLINGQKQTVEALVWWQSWRKPDPYQLTSWVVKS